MLTDDKKTEYTYLILEGLGFAVGEEFYAGKVWAELLIQEQTTWGYVPSSKKPNTALRLIELGREDLFPPEYKQWLIDNGYLEA